MEQKMIRFITPSYRELFRIPDGGKVKFIYPDARSEFTATCQYIDDYHVAVNNSVYHICELAEMVQRGGGQVVQA